MIYYNGVSYKNIKLKNFGRLLGYFKKYIGKTKLKSYVPLITCNRIELYTDEEVKLNGFVQKKGKAVIKQLYKVTSGIDSMIIGENEISQQVKQAVESSKKHISKKLSLIFERALKTAKKIRSKTKINYGKTSIASIAIEHIIEKYDPKDVAVIGSGMLGGKIAKALSRKKLNEVIVSSYRKGRAEKLANNLGCKFVDFNNFDKIMNKVDVILSATACPISVIHRKHIPKNKKLVIVDLAVPYDVEKSIDKMKNVKVIRFEYFKKIINDNKKKKTKEVKKVRGIIDDDIKRFY